MKTLKCPVCGKNLFRYHLYCYFYYNCASCGFTTPPDTHLDGAQEQAEKLIAKFPPIMRVSPGDKLKFFNHQMRQKIASIEKVILKDGWIITNKGFARPDDVILWPWELEQKEEGDKQ